MTRRAQGEGGLHWDERRERWIATVTVGYDGRGKRMVRKASGRTKTEAKTKLRELVRDRDDGLSGNGYTVRDAVEDWLGTGWAIRAQTRSISIGTCAASTSFRSWANANYAT
jgi:hypothetical protein